MATQGESLFQAALDGDVDQAQKILDEGTDPDAKDDSGSTPIHYAAKGRNPEVVELLLEYGADSNVKDGSGSTPLHYAAQDGQDRIVQLLLEYWADSNAKDGSDSTPLHIAAEDDNVIVIKLLLDSQADLFAQDNKGNIPASKIFKPNLITLLTDQGNLAISWEAQCTPTFPITINENGLGELKSQPTRFLNTKYILIQSRTHLSQSDRQKLDHAGVKHLEYVSKNTYLCQYQDGDLQKIRQLEPVVYVDIYWTEFKVAPNLKEANRDQVYEVDFVFHEGVERNRKISGAL